MVRGERGRSRGRGSDDPGDLGELVGRVDRAEDDSAGQRRTAVSHRQRFLLRPAADLRDARRWLRRLPPPLYVLLPRRHQRLQHTRHRSRHPARARLAHGADARVSRFRIAGKSRLPRHALRLHDSQPELPGSSGGERLCDHGPAQPVLAAGCGRALGPGQSDEGRHSLRRPGDNGVADAMRGRSRRLC